jgi:glucokinase
MSSLAAGFPRLLGDVGGTHARWAWQTAAGELPSHVAVQRCDDDVSIHASIARYLAVHGHPAPAWIGIGIATAVTGDWISMTNHPWSFSASELERQLHAQRCVVINDFTALALSVPVLRDDERTKLGGGEPVRGAAIGVLGPGTGLGVSGLVADPHGVWLPLSGEGGHVTLAAGDDEEARLLSLLRTRFTHVSAERILSGPGLVNLYGAVCESAGCTPRDLAPRQVTESALAADDPHCVEAVRRFTGFLGGFAGNLALTLGARSGVYIGGGVVNRLGPAFDAQWFRQRFEAKGRFTEYVRAVPTWLITAAYPALTGISQALDRELH